ncbi:MAG: hypothetical protein Kow0075_15900 [Salibacteraceae bacterium]
MDITPTQIIPSSTNCPYGYNYNVRFNYTITVSGVNTCYNGNIGIQPQIFCNSGQNNGYYTINVPAPTVGSSSTTTNYSGTLTTTTNQYRNQSDCASATPSSIGCNAVQLTIYGPGISTSTHSCSSSTLPVEWVSFRAYVDGNRVAIEWVTASEINNDYFTVERSRDGMQWETVAQVDGAGYSLDVLSYRTFDNNPYRGTSYYRLKQTDFDGKFEYGEIAEVSVETGGTTTVFVYPNPVDERLTIEGQEAELQQFSMFNLLGREVTHQIRLTRNDGNFMAVDLTELEPGMYYLKTRTQTIKVYKR